MPQKKRYFKLNYENEFCGRICGKTPIQAANKAFTRLWKLRKKQNKETVIDLEYPFMIQEMTRCSKKKKFYYVGKKMELFPPNRIYMRNRFGDQITVLFKYKNLVKKFKGFFPDSLLGICAQFVYRHKSKFKKNELKSLNRDIRKLLKKQTIN